MPETGFTKEEVDLLGRLLQGHNVRGPLRAAIRLVSRAAAEWTEPEGDLQLTQAGRQAAVQLWPNVAAADSNSNSVVPAERGPEISRQISLLVDPHQHKGTNLALALAQVLGADPQSDTLAHHVLEHYPQGRGLPAAPRRALQALGLSALQARAVVSAFSLARACQRREDTPRIDTTEQMAVEIFTSQSVADLEVEHFWVAGLDSGRRLVNLTCVAKGDLGRVDMVMREVFTPLLRARAAAAYIAHNHPSGDPRWSASDVRLTQRVMDIGKRLGIEIVDHLVLAPSGRFVSMEEEGAL